jgi:hypothetical protein
MVIGGALISFPVEVGTAVPYGYWLLTGNGPWRRYGFGSSIAVNPFRELHLANPRGSD